MKVNIDNPKELGPDRIANSVGGYKKINKEVVIVDLGTATTFDIVNQNKEYLGGSIAPGIKISLDALISRTSSLKSVELKEPSKAIGKNTYEAIQSGLVLGHASMIDSMLEKIVLESQLSPGVVITGGLGPLIQPVLNINTSVNKDELNNFLKESAFASKYREIIGYTNSPEAVSTDFYSSPYATTIDSQATIAEGNQITLYCWYDNEYGYTKQVLNLTRKVASIHLQRFPKAIDDSV